jgi:hypothetical protein
LNAALKNLRDEMKDSFAGKKMEAKAREAFDQSEKACSDIDDIKS